MSDVQWHKSSYSGASHQDCVEVAEGSERTLVRDTQHRDHGHLAFGSPAWSQGCFKVGIVSHRC